MICSALRTRSGLVYEHQVHILQTVILAEDLSAGLELIPHFVGKDSRFRQAFGRVPFGSYED